MADQKQQDARGGEELTKLNADDLDIEEIDEEALEATAGGACPTDCTSFSCSIYRPFQQASVTDPTVG